MRKTKRAGIKDLGNGVYRIRIVVTDPRTGKRVERDRRVKAPSFSQAERLRMTLIDELAAELVDKPKKRLQLGEAARGWLERKKAARRHDGSSRYAPTTMARYENAIRHIGDFLGEYYVDKLTRRDVEQWRDHLSGWLHAATVNGLLRVLRSVLRDAGSEVGDRVTPLDEDDTRITDDEPNVLSEQELGRFVAVAREHHGRYSALMMVMATTGARISTALALRWDDIDETEGVIHFRRRLSGGEVLPGVKRSRTSKDVAPLLPEVLEELKRHRAQLNEAQQESGLVFPSSEGGHRSRSVLNDVMRDVCARAGIERRLTPHGLRRTAASILRRAAGSIVSKAIVGHTTDAMHAHYAVVDQAEKKAAASAAFKPYLRVVGRSGDQSGESDETEKVSASA